MNDGRMVKRVATWHFGCKWSRSSQVLSHQTRTSQDRGLASFGYQTEIHARTAALLLCLEAWLAWQVALNASAGK